MAGKTNNYRLQTLSGGESFSINGYQFTKGDREKIDRLLYIGAESHTHTGEGVAVSNPSIPATLALSSTGGNIPAGTTVSYKYTYVDSTGAESSPSPEVSITTAAAVGAPTAPSLARYNSGGSLIAGNYYYVLTAYKDVETSETRPGDNAFVTLSSTVSTWRVELTLPSLPVGATGFNVYRRAPGESKYSYMESVDMNVATPPTTYVDDGSLSTNCNRQPPVRNNTNASNSVGVSLPGATPTVPEGFTWKLYRTYTTGDYNNSLLSWVVEETFENSGVITPEYTDTGTATSAGAPPAFSEFIASPGKIDFTDMANVDGYIPVGRVVTPKEITFTFPGTLDSVVEGTFCWTCEYEYAEIVGCRATLGRGSYPASDNVIVDVNIYDGATPSWTSIYTTQSNRPTVLVGNQQGSRSVPDITALTVGDMLSVDIDQVGGGATPTDYDLVVTVYMLVREDVDGDVSPTGILGIS